MAEEEYYRVTFSVERCNKIERLLQPFKTTKRCGNRACRSWNEYRWIVGLYDEEIVEERGTFLKDRRIKGYSTKKKGVLEKKVKELKEKEALEEYERKLRDRALCSACLKEQIIQRKMDEKTHNQRLLDSMIRDLTCKYTRNACFRWRICVL